MGCPITLADANDIWGIIQWGNGWVFPIFLLSTFFPWRRKWWEYLSVETFAPREMLVFIGLTTLALANTFAGWRHWYCNNWDVDPTPLAVFFFMTIMAGLYFPLLNLAPSPIPAFLTSLAAAGLAVTFAVFSLIEHDTWAAIVGFVDAAAYLAMCLLALQLWGKPSLYISFAEGGASSSSKKNDPESPKSSAIGSNCGGGSRKKTGNWEMSVRKN